MDANLSIVVILSLPPEDVEKLLMRIVVGAVDRKEGRLLEILRHKNAGDEAHDAAGVTAYA